MTVLDTNPFQIPKYKKPHKWFHNDSLDNLDAFNRYLNWLSGEFTLYQQDELNGLKVYFPNGYFFVEKNKIDTNRIDFNIEVVSKCLKTGIKIFNLLVQILRHVKDFKNSKST